MVAGAACVSKFRPLRGRQLAPAEVFSSISARLQPLMNRRAPSSQFLHCRDFLRASSLNQFAIFV